MRARFGTQLRHLLDLCDSAVAQAYEDSGLDYSPRYTPVLRALIEREPQTIGEIATAARITQPAATQTVSVMVKKGLLSVRRGQDARQRDVRLTKYARALLPKIEACWDATALAHADLEAEIGIPLSEHLDRAIAALERESLGARIAQARVLLQRNKH